MKSKKQPQKAPAEIACSAGKLKKTKKIKSFVYFREGDAYSPWNGLENRRSVLAISPQENGLHR